MFFKSLENMKYGPLQDSEIQKNKRTWKSTYTCNTWNVILFHIISTIFIISCAGSIGFLAGKHKTFPASTELLRIKPLLQMFPINKTNE